MDEMNGQRWDLYDREQRHLRTGNSANVTLFLAFFYPAVLRLESLDMGKLVIVSPLALNGGMLLLKKYTYFVVM